MQNPGRQETDRGWRNGQQPGQDMGSEGSNQNGPVGEKGIGPSETRPGQENKEHFTANVSWASPQQKSCSLNSSATTFLSFMPQTAGPQPRSILGMWDEFPGGGCSVPHGICRI